MLIKSNFQSIWQSLLRKQQLPKRYTGLITLRYSEFKEMCNNFDKQKSYSLVRELVNGKILLVKQSFNNNEVNEIKIKVKEFWQKNPDTYHKMIEGCPDFHRIITPEIAKNYSIGAVRHTTYFFPWNSDPCNFNSKIYERWRFSKILAGLSANEYEKNTPKNGAVDRIQIVCYPPGFGGVETHIDTDSNNPLAISCYLSDRKNDFNSGGFYCLDIKGKKIDLEPYIDSGDMSLYCPTIEHGVDRIDKNVNSNSINNYDWNSGIGRWWMGLFTNDSNEKKNRKTSTSLEKKFYQN